VHGTETTLAEPVARRVSDTAWPAAAWVGHHPRVCRLAAPAGCAGAWRFACETRWSRVVGSATRCRSAFSPHRATVSPHVMRPSRYVIR